MGGKQQREEGAFSRSRSIRDNSVPLQSHPHSDGEGLAVNDSLVKQLRARYSYYPSDNSIRSSGRLLGTVSSSSDQIGSNNNAA